jgi:hypothetical protein
MSEAAGTEVVVAPVGTEVATQVDATKVAPVVETSLELEDPKVEGAAAEGEFESTGDPAMDLALEFITGLGISMADPAILAAEKGDFSALEAKLKGLGDKAKGWEKRIAIGKSYIDRQAKEAAGKAEKDAAAVHNAVGGKEQWLTIKAWAVQATADSPEERKQVNAALAQGGKAAEAMAVYLAGKFQKSTGTVVKPAAKIVPGQRQTPASDGPMTQKAMMAKVQELRKSLGHNFENSSEYKALVAQRTAARNAGR